MPAERLVHCSVRTLPDSLGCAPVSRVASAQVGQWAVGALRVQCLQRANRASRGHVHSSTYMCPRRASMLSPPSAAACRPAHCAGRVACSPAGHSSSSRSALSRARRDTPATATICAAAALLACDSLCDNRCQVPTPTANSRLATLRSSAPQHSHSNHSICHFCELLR